MAAKDKMELTMAISLGSSIVGCLFHNRLAGRLLTSKYYSANFDIGGATARPRRMDVRARTSQVVQHNHVHFV